jgi:hypothetical protein
VLSPLVLLGRENQYGKVDDAQVEELRRWAKGLSTDTRPEVKAAAKAIFLLSEDVLAARSQLLEERLIREALEAREAADEPQAVNGSAGVQRELLQRVRTLLHRRAARLTG